MTADPILSDPRGHDLALEIAPETIGIEADLPRVINEHGHYVFRFAPRFLILVKLVVHFPEAVLQTGGLSRLRGHQSVFVRCGIQRIFPKDYAKPIAELSFHLLYF